jgi:hypothetical protein
MGPLAALLAMMALIAVVAHLAPAHRHQVLAHLIEAAW